MALDREAQVRSTHPAAVVADRQMLDAASLQRHRDPRRPGVERVFDQFLQRRRRAFDDFAGGDLVDEGVGQAADGHAPPTLAENAAEVHIRSAIALFWGHPAGVAR